MQILTLIWLLEIPRIGMRLKIRAEIVSYDKKLMPAIAISKTKYQAASQ